MQTGVSRMRIRKRNIDNQHILELQTRTLIAMNAYRKVARACAGET